jgi:hypothetical protein
MNTVVVRRRNVEGPSRSQRRRRNRRAQQAQPVIVVAGPRTTRNRRRRLRRLRTRRGGIVPRGSGSSETFVFSKDNLMGSASGSFTFGPSLSDCPAFKDGILKAYHEYRITSILLQFLSEASSTSAGSISYELAE